MKLRHVLCFLIMLGFVTLLGAFGNAAIVSAAKLSPAATEVLNVAVYGDRISGNEVCVAGPGCMTTSLRAGDVVTITYNSGQVTFDTNPPCLPAAAVYTVNADGLARSIYEDPGNMFCYNWERGYVDPLTVPTSGHAGLFMMQNATRTFIGAAGTTFIAFGSQSFYLGVNDGLGTNNSGQFNTTVTIVRTATHIVTNTNDSGDGSLRQAILDANANVGLDTISFDIAGGAMPQAKSPAATEVLNVTVYGDRIGGNETCVAGPWCITASLRAGDQVTITYNSGQVNFDTTAGTTCLIAGIPYTVTAAGLPLSTFYDPSLALCYSNDRAYTDPLPGDPHAGLFTLRNAARNFIGATTAAFTATGSESFYLGVNDASGTGSIAPNSGQFNTTVTIVRTSNHVVTNTNDSGDGSLRQAILDANANAGADTINFNIASVGVKTIVPLSPLPTVTDPVIINGYSQPGASANSLATSDNAVILIELNGASAGVSAHGLNIGAGGAGSTIKGLVINRFGGNGIYITSGSNIIAGNFIGTSTAGTVASGNADGVYISNAASNSIGTTNVADRNIISGNNVDGIRIDGAGSTGNLVLNNYIGTDRSGTLDLGNTYNGIVITGAPNNTIGDTTGNGRNVISGNNQYGIAIAFTGATNNLVQGNFIGANVNGNTAIANTLSGVLIQNVPTNTVGTATANGYNLISGNGSHGVEITGTLASGNVVQWNVIGANLAANAAMANFNDGVHVENASNNTIGGATSVQRNLISGNGQNGIAITNGSNNTVRSNYIGTNAAGTSVLANTSAGVNLYGALTNNLLGNVLSGNQYGILMQAASNGNTVQSNSIGTDAGGTIALANTSDGIALDSSSNNAIGGASTDLGNRIMNNGRYGIGIFSGTGNGIHLNSIYANTNLGIDLGGNGVTPNDPSDTDSGVNLLQNFPVLTSAVSASNTTIQGTLNSVASKTYRVEFFSNVACDPSGYGEGQTYLGFQSVTTNGSGNATINYAASPAVPQGRSITASASDPNNNTSEFSQCIQVTANTADLSISKTDALDPVIAGQNITYTIVITNTGPGNAASVVMTDTVPTNTTFVSLSGGAGFACTTPSVGGTGTINCTNASWNVGVSTTFTFVVKVNAGVTNGTTITNTARISSNTADPNTANNAATTTTMVQTLKKLYLPLILR